MIDTILMLFVVICVLALVTQCRACFALYERNMCVASIKRSSRNINKVNSDYFGIKNKMKSRMSTALAIQTTPFPYPIRIAVMGGGNFGLALASVTARKGIPTTILVRSQNVADKINNENCHPTYMTDFLLPARLRATTDPAECLPDATYIVHAVPVQYSREFLSTVSEHIPPATPVVSGSKGIETTSLGFMADILKDCLGEERSYAFLSGPSFAREICEGVATAVVIASEDILLARDLADLISDNNFRVFISSDVIGVEIGGAVKNVIALAAGMCEGLGLGTNAMSALVTRGCGEMRRLGVKLGAQPSTIAGLSGKYIVKIMIIVYLVYWRLVDLMIFDIRSWRHFRNVLWSVVSKPKVWIPLR
jgi:glycerol-3-phosphate dehydrogenase (NAD+)